MTPPAATPAAPRTRRRIVNRHEGWVAAPAQPRFAAPRPRRVSGPAPAPPARRGSTLRPSRGARLLAWVRALPDHRLTDRLVRGRAWIVLVGFLLLGIVAMQVTLLKLNSGIGRAVAQRANLERRNGELRAAVSRLSAESRVQAMGAKLGLVAPEAGQVTYLSPRGGQDAKAAAEALRAWRATATALPAPAPGDGPPPTSDAAPGDERAAAPSTESPGPDSSPATPASEGAAVDASAPPRSDPAPTAAPGAGAGAVAAPGR